MISKLWNNYKNKVNSNCNPTSLDSVRGVSYWRNSLFSTTMIYVLPLCFIAFLPALLLISYENKEYITTLHLITIGVMFFIAFGPKVKVEVRKLVFSLTVFAFTIILNIFTSPSSGSVLVYFLAACIYSIIIFDNKYAYWWSHFVLFISAMFGFAIYFEWFDFSYNVDMSSANEWIAVSSNLIFLCYLSSALIPKIFIGIENYIIEQSSLKAELEKSKMSLEIKNNELEQYTYVASHDLQEPLRMVTSFMDKLNSNYGDQLDDKALLYIDYATDGAKRMKQIILDLLLYSRVNMPSEEEKNVDLNEIILAFLATREKSITEKGAEINYDKLPVLNTYEAPVVQIFHSLLDNALKYSRDVPPVINVSVKETGKFYEFAVEDNGIGIDENFYDKIFIIFQRLHNRKDDDGTGIGLSITKRAVEFLGGEIWLESVVGKGSTFYFTIQKK